MGIDYFEQLTSEKLVDKKRASGVVKVWEKKPGVRNEALDLRVYNYACVKMLNPLYADLKAQLETDDDESRPDYQKQPPVKRRRKRRGVISKGL